MSHNDIMFTLETQMGKTNFNGYSILILRIFGYNVTHGSLCILSSLAKIPFESHVKRTNRIYSWRGLGYISVSPIKCLYPTWTWGGTPYEWLTLPMSQLTLYDIRLTLILHESSKTWLPMRLYKIWSHILPLHMITSSEVWYPMNYSGRLLLRTRSWHLSPSKIWLFLRWYLVGPSASPLVEPPTPPHNCDSM